jgi:hypothetical protein
MALLPTLSKMAYSVFAPVYNFIIVAYIFQDLTQQSLAQKNQTSAMKNI